MKEWLALHWIDIAILVSLVWYGLDGWTRGFWALCLETLGFLLALTLATFGYRPLGTDIAFRFSTPESFANAIAFFGVWWLVDLAWPLVSRVLYRRLPDKWQKANINHAFGLVPGLVNGILILSVILTVVSAFPLSTAIKRQATESPLERTLLSVTSGYDRLIGPAFGPLAERSVNTLKIHPSTDESIDLHFTLHGGTVDADGELAMLKLVNDERTARGLSPLVLNLQLIEAARAHAKDMFERGYFSHVTPEGLTPPDRLDRAKITYGTMGENLALAPEIMIAHDGLMKSPGHRANILSERFRKIGIGVIDGGVYGEMFVQEFTD